MRRPLGKNQVRADAAAAAMTALGWIILAAFAPGRADAAPASPQPVFSEDFAEGAGTQLFENWRVSKGLDAKLWPLRIAVVPDPIGRSVGRITVEEGDALAGASAAAFSAKHPVCDAEGSRAAEIEAEPGGGAPTERAEIQVKSRELVKFGAPVWYRFSFKVPAEWPRDLPVAGRMPCRTVIHQIKQNSARNGADCGASPFFKIEARPLGAGVLFFAQITEGPACTKPAAVKRTPICVVDDLPREIWHSVNVRLFPAQDENGRADLWLDGRPCGAYQGPMGDAEDGTRRNGIPTIDVQPRFGIYRDWRAERQTIYFDRIVFWNADPADHPDWGVAPQQ
jgi:Polysaccharide lyase